MLKDYTWWLQAEYFVWDVDLCCVWRLLSGSRDTGGKRLKRFSWLWVHVGFCGISLTSCQVCAIFHSLWGLWRAWGMSWFYKYFLCGGFGWFFSPQWQSYLGTLICISLLWSMWGPALRFLVWGASAGIGISFLQVSWSSMTWICWLAVPAFVSVEHGENKWRGNQVAALFYPTRKTRRAKEKYPVWECARPTLSKG